MLRTRTIYRCSDQGGSLSVYPSKDKSLVAGRRFWLICSRKVLTSFAPPTAKPSWLLPASPSGTEDFKSQKVRDDRSFTYLAVEGPGAMCFLSGYCNRSMSGHLRLVYQRRSAVVDRVGCPPCPGSLPSVPRSCHRAQSRWSRLSQLEFLRIAAYWYEY